MDNDTFQLMARVLTRLIRYNNDPDSIVKFLQAGGTEAVFTYVTESVYRTGSPQDCDKTLAFVLHAFIHFAATAERHKDVIKPVCLPLARSEMIVVLIELVYSFFWLFEMIPHLPPESALRAVRSAHRILLFISHFADQEIVMNVLKMVPEDPDDQELWITRCVRTTRLVKQPSLEWGCKQIMDWATPLLPSLHLQYQQLWQQERTHLVGKAVHHCARPGCPINTTMVLTQLRKCKRCRAIYYCGPPCQAKHWKEHRPHCVKVTFT